MFLKICCFWTSVLLALATFYCTSCSRFPRQSHLCFAGVMFSFLVYSYGLVSMKQDLCNFIHSFFCIFIIFRRKRGNFLYYTAINVLKIILFSLDSSPSQHQFSPTHTLFFYRVAFFFRGNQRYQVLINLATGLSKIFPTV